MRLTKDDRRRFGCNISFVGRSGYLHYRKYCELIQDPSLKGIFEEVVQRMHDDPTLRVKDLIVEAESSRGVKICYTTEDHRRLLQITLEYAAMSLFRKEIIESVSEFGCCVYGDESWREAVEGVRYLGWIDRNSDLPKLYNATKINLNITMPQLRTTLPLRIFDITACGGFVLTDIREDLKSCFEIEGEVAVYSDHRELKKKVEYFLNHPREREEMAERAMARTLQDHTYLRRMEYLVDIMEELYG